MNIWVISFGDSYKYCQYHHELLPTFIGERNAQFYLEVSENKDLGFPSPKLNRTSTLYPKDPKFKNLSYRHIVC